MPWRPQSLHECVVECVSPRSPYRQLLDTRTFEVENDTNATPFRTLKLSVVIDLLKIWDPYLGTCLVGSELTAWFVRRSAIFDCLVAAANGPL
jgi:hypothetical protein